MGFNNPLTGLNGSLIYPQIKSPNFNLTAQTGWAILKNGDAYFFNVVATGSITASEFIGTDFVIDSSGEFFYNGTPAHGTLAYSIAPASGTDSYGNAYVEGWASYYSDGTVAYNVAPAGSGGSSLYVASDASGHPTIGLGSDFGGSASGLPYLAASNNTSGLSADLILGTADNGWFTQSISAQNPSNASIAETWHTANLATGFTTGGSDQAPRYRLEATGTGLVVRLDGTAYANAVVASGATMFTLPTGYQPKTRKRFVGPTNLASYTLGGMTAGVSTAGVVTIGAAGVSTNQVVLDGMTYPLD